MQPPTLEQCEAIVIIAEQAERELFDELAHSIGPMWARGARHWRIERSRYVVAFSDPSGDFALMTYPRDHQELLEAMCTVISRLPDLDVAWLYLMNGDRVGEQIARDLVLADAVPAGHA